MSIYYEVETFYMTKVVTHRDGFKETSYLNIEAIDWDDLASVDIEYDEDQEPKVHTIDILVMPTSDGLGPNGEFGMDDGYDGDRDPIIDISIGHWVENYYELAADIENLLTEKYPIPEYDAPGRTVKDGEW